MADKKGLSEIVTTVIMIALVMAAAAIIWGVVNSMLTDTTQDTQACFGNYDKVTLYGEGTCYDPINKRASVYIDIRDINVTKVIVSIHTESETKSFEIPGTNADVSIYSSTPSFGSALSSIFPNSGKRYLINLESKPTSIDISPVISGSQCGISDTIKTIDICS